MSYNSITLTTNESLSWEYPFTGGEIACDVNDLLVQVNGLTLTMPPANTSYLGSTVRFNNLGPFPVTIAEFGSIETIVVIAALSVVDVYLIDNSTASGSWRPVVITGGTIGVIGLNVGSSDATVTVTGSPVQAGEVGNITVGTNATLQAIGALNAQGIVVSTKPDGSNFVTRSLVAGKNITITNADGSGGNMKIDALIESFDKLTVNNLKTTNDITATNITATNITATNITLSTPYIPIGCCTSQVFFTDTNTLTTTPIGNIVNKQSAINIASITGANGLYTVTFTKPYLDGTYIVQLTLSQTTNSIYPIAAFFTNRTSNTFNIVTVDSRGNIIPVTAGISVSVWGTLTS